MNKGTVDPIQYYVQCSSCNPAPNSEHSTILMTFLTVQYILQQCIECNGQQPPNCVVGDPSTDGSGVSNTDYILYISANQDVCPGQSTLAFAGACQMESSVDRPIAGYINFCPGNLEETTRDFLFDVTKHELLHALAFSSSLIPFWRNSDGTPRTSRLSGNLPPFDSEYVTLLSV